MTDKELLELAAKAHGGLVYIEDTGWIHEDIEGYRGAWWNPLDNDRDALRLAVKLEIDILFDFDRIETRHDDGYCAAYLYEKPKQTDKYAATRRAIVRAAAEIGKTLTKEN